MNKNLNIKSYFKQDLEDVNNLKSSFERLYKRIKKIYWGITLFVTFIILIISIIKSTQKDLESLGDYLVYFFLIFLTANFFLYVIAGIIYVFFFLLIIKGSLQVNLKKKHLSLFEKIKKHALSFILPESFELLEDEMCDDIIKSRFPSGFHKVYGKDNRFICIGQYLEHSFLYTQIKLSKTIKTPTHRKIAVNCHFLTLDLEKTIDGQLIIGKKNKWELIGDPKKPVLFNSDLKKVKTDAHTFNRIFDAYTTHSYISDKLLSEEIKNHLVQLNKDMKEDLFIFFSQDHFGFIYATQMNWNSWHHSGFSDIPFAKINKDIETIIKLRETIIKMNNPDALKQIS